MTFKLTLKKIGKNTIQSQCTLIFIIIDVVNQVELEEEGKEKKKEKKGRRLAW
jgi:hypothetical protein